MTALGLVLALLVGLSLGLLGGGGSILTVPIFVYVMGFEAKQAIAMSLVVVGAVSLIGAVRHWRAGRVDVRVAVIFGIIAMVASYLGARVATYMSGAVQLILLAVVICAAAASMLRSARASNGAAGVGGGATPSVAEPEDSAGVPPTVGRLAPIGIGVGMLTGLVGVGGGFLIVPALVVLGEVPIRLAIGTSLLIIALNCAAGVVGYLGRVAMPWGIVALFTAVAAGGIIVGTRLTGIVSPASLKRGFAVLLLAVGTFMLAKNHRVIADAMSSGGHRALHGAGVGMRAGMRAGTAVAARTGTG